MSIKLWWQTNTQWLCERWDILWSVKKNKPKGKLKDTHWVDHSEWDNSDK